MTAPVAQFENRLSSSTGDTPHSHDHGDAHVHGHSHDQAAEEHGHTHEHMEHAGKLEWPFTLALSNLINWGIDKQRK